MTAAVSQVCVDDGPVTIDSVQPITIDGAGYELTGFAIEDVPLDQDIQATVPESIQDRFGRTNHDVDARCSDESRDAYLYLEVSRPTEPFGTIEGIRLATSTGQKIEVNYVLTACRDSCF